MWHELVADESAFFNLLIEIDETLAAEAKNSRCPCGGRLDRADYPRKPRGIPQAWQEAFSTRISFCCAKEGCRRRITPPSLRFLGRRVYIAATILVVCSRWMSARQAEVPSNTARRWRRFFDSILPTLPFWRNMCGRLMPPLNLKDVVASLLNRFLEKGQLKAQALFHGLSFFKPLSTSYSRKTMLK
jgi:hypothetical protein